MLHKTNLLCPYLSVCVCVCVVCVCVCVCEHSHVLLDPCSVADLNSVEFACSMSISVGVPL